MTGHEDTKRTDKQPVDPAARPPEPPADTRDKPRAKEIGGRKGPEPTRYGDWEKNGRCIDF